MAGGMVKPGMHGSFKDKYLKVTFIAILIAVVLCLHYFTLPRRAYYHAVYRMLFYIPLIMAGFWYGLRGALTVLRDCLGAFFPLCADALAGIIPGRI